MNVNEYESNIFRMVWVIHHEYSLQPVLITNVLVSKPKSEKLNFNIVNSLIFKILWVEKKRFIADLWYKRETALAWLPYEFL